MQMQMPPSPQLVLFLLSFISLLQFLSFFVFVPFFSLSFPIYTTFSFRIRLCDMVFFDLLLRYTQLSLASFRWFWSFFVFFRGLVLFSSCQMCDVARREIARSSDRFVLLAQERFFLLTHPTPPLVSEFDLKERRNAQFIHTAYYFLFVFVIYNL